MPLVREIKISKKASSFTESVIRDMTRLAIKHNAINLAQGFPDFAAPQEIKEAAKRAIDADINQYAITWGAKPFRDAIAQKFERTYGVAVDPETQLCVTCGSTEAMMSAALAINDRTRAIIINTPNNPTGKVFTRAELDQIAALCQKWGVVAITDEIYEFM